MVDFAANAVAGIVFLTINGETTVLTDAEARALSHAIMEAAHTAERNKRERERVDNEGKE